MSSDAKEKKRSFRRCIEFPEPMFRALWDLAEKSGISYSDQVRVACSNMIRIMAQVYAKTPVAPIVGAKTVDVPDSGD